LEQVLQYAMHPELNFDLPVSDPPFKRDLDVPLGMSYSTLQLESKRLYLFLKGYGDNIQPQRKEQLFIDMLEGLHPTEADVLLMMKNKNLEEFYPNITYDLVYNTIPELLPKPSNKVTKPEPIMEVSEKVEVNSDQIF
jgi:hypothetical protein